MIEGHSSRFSVVTFIQASAAAAIPAVLLLGAWWLVSQFWTPAAPRQLIAPPLQFSQYFETESDHGALGTLATERTLATLDPGGTKSRIADLVTIGGMVVVAAEGRLDVIDGSTGNTVAEFGSTDPEKAALFSPSSVDALEHLGQVWVYTFRTGDFARFDLADRAGLAEVVGLESGLFNPIWVDDRILAGGGFADGILHLYTSADANEYNAPDDHADRWEELSVARRFMDLVGATDRPLFPGVVQDVAVHLNQTHIAYDPQRRRIAAAFLHASRIHIYSAEGHLDRAIAGPIETKLDFSIDLDSQGYHHFRINSETVLTYLDVAVDSDFAFALFSGRPFADGDQYRGDQIHVFDWSGKLVGVWMLDQKIEKIALDHLARRLYGLRTSDLGVVQFSVAPIDEFATSGVVF